MSNDTKNELVQNGTTMDHDNDVSISDIEQGLGQIRVFETDDEIVVTHYVSARERFFSEYSKFAVKTAQSSVEMCRVIYEAKESLDKSEYASFLKDIGRKTDDSTIRKYLAIGERYDDLIAYANLLPSSWTSIYEITQIPSESFMAMVATGESMAHLTGAQLKLLRGIDSSAKPSTPDSSSVSLTMPSTNVKKSVTASSSTNGSEQSADSDNTDATVDAADGAVAAHTTVSATCAAISTDDEDADSSSDNEFAQQATSSLLERVSQNANLTVEADDLDVVDEESDQPYDIVIKFNSRPSDIAMHAIVDALLSVFRKHNVDAEVGSAKEQTV
jgi:2C-methyl-D-erythritol 2,4-cyclodiphosphate synthase